jgi:L-aspartate oxidase
MAATAAENLRPAWPRVVPPPSETAPVRDIMSRGAGVVRECSGLIAAIGALRTEAFGAGAQSDAALCGLLIATAALAREESRGAHFRSDFPDHTPGNTGRAPLRLNEARDLVDRILPETATVTSGA